MSWSFGIDTRYNRAALMADLQSPTRLSPGYVALKHRFVGNHHWYLYSTPEGKKVIGLDLMAGGGRGREKMGWGYKGMSEQSGPNELDCPLSLLDEADEPEGHAIAWREKVRAFHAKKKQLTSARKAGAKVVCNGTTFTLEESMGRQGWAVLSENGTRYRMSARTLGRVAFA